jgi:hypothetical protein
MRFANCGRKNKRTLAETARPVIFMKKGELGPPANSPRLRRAAFPSRLRAIR